MIKVCRKISEVKNWVGEIKCDNKRLGFIPTMGALHDGHLNIVKHSVNENDFTAVSVFVNPIQFNNKEDLLKYPRTEKTDIEKLEQAGCSMVFIPSVEEMYPCENTLKYDMGGLDSIMEGEFRPGHFNGVAVVCNKLFDIMSADNAYFGEKDFQQLTIIKYLCGLRNDKLKIHGYPIVREDSGLALSSRNSRLSKQEHEAAAFIYQTMLVGKKLSEKNENIEFIKSTCEKMFELNPYFVLDYFVIADKYTLKPATDSVNARMFIAAYIGDVRLIDNMDLN